MSGARSWHWKPNDSRKQHGFVFVTHSKSDPVCTGSADDFHKLYCSLLEGFPPSTIYMGFLKLELVLDSAWRGWMLVLQTPMYAKNREEIGFRCEWFTAGCSICVCEIIYTGTEKNPNPFLMFSLNSGLVPVVAEKNLEIYCHFLLEIQKTVKSGWRLQWPLRNDNYSVFLELSSIFFAPHSFLPWLLIVHWFV